MILTRFLHDWLGTILRTGFAARRRLRVDASGSAATIADLLALWRERVRSRRQLAKLDSRMQKDIGVTRADINAEVRKPFWRG